MEPDDELIEEHAPREPYRRLWRTGLMAVLALAILGGAIAGGIVRQVSAELGAGVQLGQPLAVIFSSELAEAQMKYLSMQAMLHADHQKLQRTQKLVELGAASRQELEEV